MGKNKRLLDVLWHDGTHLADAIMFLTSSVMKHEKTWGAKLTGREGTAWLMGRLAGESAESPYAEGFRSLQKTVSTFEGPTGYFANMTADALACVRDPARKPRSSAIDGLRVIEYLHSVKPWFY
ncbi:MAG: hypothetical protein LBK02_01155 [Treponema sp.]|jgi:hypothetical protein|nr:hypothetical protein [Treponema sp.]